MMSKNLVVFNPSYIFQSNQHKPPKNEENKHQQMFNQLCTMDSLLDMIRHKIKDFGLKAHLSHKEDVFSREINSVHF